MPNPHEYQPCGTCGGSGQVVCISHNGRYCNWCNGSGMVTCPTCGGTGQGPRR